MSSYIEFGGILPFAVLFVILIATKRSLVVASAGFLFTSAVLAMLVWFVVPSTFFSSIIKGLFVSLDIALIIAGSLFFLDVLKKTRVISSMEHYLHRLCPDSRVQSIVIVWLFGGLIEGASGFGTPAAVVTPLLVHLGFSPVTSATMSLLANTVPVSYGAVGTPVRVGLGTITSSEVTGLIGVMGGILALFIPLLLVMVLKRDLRPHRGIIGPHGMSHAVHSGMGLPSSVIPFALWSGLVFAIPFWITSRIGPEFPALIGSMAGLLLTMYMARLNWWRKLFLPKITQRISNYDPNEIPLHIWRVLLPYVLMVGFLIIGRVFLPFWQIHLPGGITHQVTLFNPGLIMIVLGGFLAFHSKLNQAEIRHSMGKISVRMIRLAAITTMLVAAVQLMIHSYSNTSGYQSMLHGFVSVLRRENVSIFSPIIGLLGGFAAGSTTVSNLMFGQIQWNTAEVLGTSGILIVCLQVYGATAGNALSLSNISAIESVLGLRHQVRPILTHLIVPISLYFVLIVLVGSISAIFL